jgi:hypothetical protein
MGRVCSAQLSTLYSLASALLSSALSTLYSQRRTREYHLGVSARTRAYGNLRSSLPGCIVRVPEQTNSYSTYLGETDARS